MSALNRSGCQTVNLTPGSISNIPVSGKLSLFAATQCDRTNSLYGGQTAESLPTHLQNATKSLYRQYVIAC
jgi:hypothetical protein